MYESNMTVTCMTLNMMRPSHHFELHSISRYMASTPQISSKNIYFSSHFTLYSNLLKKSSLDDEEKKMVSDVSN